MDKNAFFSDESENFMIPPEPEPGETVRILFRTAKDDAVRVELKEAEDGTDTIMFRSFSDDYFDYYESRMEAGQAPSAYSFRISDGQETVYYDRAGLSGTYRPEFCFSVMPGFHTPDWAKGAIMYQIFVDRFCRGDETNNVCDDEYIYIGLPVRHIADWHGTVLRIFIQEAANEKLPALFLLFS